MKREHELSKDIRREIIIAIILMILAVCTFIYPHIQHRLFIVRAHNVVTEFETRVEAYRLAHQQNMINLNRDDVALEEDTRFWLYNVNSWLAFMNHMLYLENQENLVDPFMYNHPCFNLQQFGLDSDIVGVIYIPAIELNMPIYLGTSMQNLHNGAAHLLHSSFPVGGNNTNAVIAGHRNTTHARVFRDIEQLEIGDEIQITNFFRTMMYEVVEIKTANPYDVDALAIQSGRDLVTLVTTAHRRGNGRYVVVAERVV